MKSELLIRELAGLKREIRLRGAALPRQGAAQWGGKQRLITTWYPGNSAEATQQVLGPIENQSVFSGVWNTTRLTRLPAIYSPTVGTETPVAFADGLREIVETLLRGGTLLQVLWINAEAATFGGRSIQRLGRATDWNFNYTRMDDLDWSITFEWASRGLSQQRVTQFRDDGTNAGKIAYLNNIILSVDESINSTKIQLSKRTIPKSANKFTLEQLGQIADGPGRLMKDFSQSMNRLSNRVKTLGDLINKVKGLPYELATQLIDACTGGIIAANHLRDSITQTPPEKYTTQQSLAALTRAAAYMKGGTDSADAVSSALYEQSATIRASVDVRRTSGPDGKALPPRRNVPSVLNGSRLQVQTYLVRKGDTLASISMKFYGVIEGAYGIAFGNGLPLKTVSPPVGRVLIIPNLSTGPKGSKLPATAPAPGQVVLPGGVGKLPTGSQ